MFIVNWILFVPDGDRVFGPALEKMLILLWSCCRCYVAKLLFVLVMSRVVNVNIRCC